MIISAPTALYLSILPDKPSTAGNITWTISSNNPPRILSETAIIPKIEEIKPLPPIVFDPSKRQVNTGDMVSNISYTFRSKVGIGNKSYESGQILEFTDTVDAPSSSALMVPDVIDLQQNTNIIDLDSMGLTDQEVEKLTVEARTKLNNLISTINSILSNIRLLGVSISDNQKLINETQKAYNASLESLGSSDEITIKLNNRISSLNESRTTLIGQYNESQSIANDYYKQILIIKELVR